MFSVEEIFMMAQKNNAMKIRNALALGLILGSIQPQLLPATDMFQLSWKGTVHYTDQSGNVVTRSFSDKDVIRQVAANNGLDPAQLVLVYRPDAFDTAVVVKATGQVIADYQQMPDITQPDQRTDVANPDGTLTVRQAFLFDEAHGITPGHQIGSICGTEKVKRDADGNRVSYNFHGTFQFAIPESGGEWQTGVYSGAFATGKRIVDTTGS